MIIMFDLFSDFFDGFDVFMQPAVTKEEKRCPVCGRTYSDFRRTGKLGCGECYKTFRSAVAETLRQVHSSNVHTGKIPSKSGEELKLKRRLTELKNELAEAVKAEDYERAAKLHKEVRAMEQEVKKS